MRKIYKYEIPMTDSFSLPLPKGAEIIYVGLQRGEPQMWALVDPAAETELRSFCVHGTGHTVAEGDLKHLGSLIMHGDALVVHVFEKV